MKKGCTGKEPNEISIPFLPIIPPREKIPIFRWKDRYLLVNRFITFLRKVEIILGGAAYCILSALFLVEKASSSGICPHLFGLGFPHRRCVLTMHPIAQITNSSECFPFKSAGKSKKGDKKEGDGISVPSPRSFALLYYMSEKLRSMRSS